ncbi:MAG: helix-turn-helix transcriptional regulator [Terricaulis sp.]
MPEPSNIQFRARRRETGLVQEDIAFLLGFKDPSSVSRFERLTREPDIRTAFACEYILGASARSLFEPLFNEVKRVVSARSLARLDALKALAHDARHAARLTHLVKLAEQPPTLFDV